MSEKKETNEIFSSFGCSELRLRNERKRTSAREGGGKGGRERATTHSKSDLKGSSILESDQSNELVLSFTRHALEESDVEDQTEDTVCSHDWRGNEMTIKRFSGRDGNEGGDKKTRDSLRRGTLVEVLMLSLQRPVPRSFQIPLLPSMT